MKVLKIKQLLLVFKASKGFFDGHVNIYHMKVIFLHQSNFLKGSYVVIDRYLSFITDTDYLYVYVPDNRYAEPIFIYCYKVNK